MMRALTTDPRARMRRTCARRADLWLVTLLTLLGAGLRVHDYRRVPRESWMGDEHAFVWSGVTLLTEGAPRSWSELPAYGDVPLTTLPTGSYRIVSPWFDHPPLMGILYGSFCIAAGERRIFDPSIRMMRIPSLVLGTLAIPLLHAYARRAAGRSAARWATALFAVAPAVVVASRTVLAETVLVPLALGALVLAGRGLDRGRRGPLVAALALAGVAPLFKITGVFVALALALELVAAGRTRTAVAALLAGGAGLLAYALFGMAYDPALFRAVLSDHQARAQGLDVLRSVVWCPLFGVARLMKAGVQWENWVIDALYVWGWLALVGDARIDAARLELPRRTATLPVIAYLLVVVAAGAHAHWMPWYHLPFYPFLLVALGRGIDRCARRPSTLWMVLFVSFPGLWILDRLRQVVTDGVLRPPASVRLPLVAGLMLLVLAYVLGERRPAGDPARKALGLATRAVFAAFVAANALVAWRYGALG